MTVLLEYTKPMLKEAIGCYIKRTYLKQGLGISLLAIIVLILSLWLESPLLQAFTVVLVVAIPTMFLLGYYFRIQDSLKRLDLLDNGKASITATDSCLILESKLGKSEMNWPIFTGLWEFQTAYLLFYHNHQFITLPKSQVTPDFINFIRTKLVNNSN